jgi:hypothetical protein
MKSNIYFSIVSICTVASLHAASSFMPNASSVVYTDGTINTSSFGTDKTKAAEFEVGTGNSYISFTSLATRGNLQEYFYPTYITSTVSGNGGTFDLILRTASLENSAIANPTATTNQSYDRHKIRSNGDTDSFTFTQTYSQGWMPSRQFLANPSLSGNLIWSLAQGVDFSGTGQDTSLVAIDVRYYDEDLNLIDLTSVEFRSVASSSGYGNAASFSQTGTTATMIYKAGVTNSVNPAGLGLTDFNTGNLNNEFIGRIEYTFRTTDGSDFANNIAFQYTTNGAVYASSPEVIPEPTAIALIGVGAFSLVLRRRR